MPTISGNKIDNLRVTGDSFYFETANLWKIERYNHFNSFLLVSSQMFFYI